MILRALATLLALSWPWAGQAQDAPAPDMQRPASRPADAQDQMPSPRAAAKVSAPQAPTSETPQPPSEPALAGPSPAPPVHQALREDDFAYSACLLDLTLLGAEFSPGTPVTDPRQRDCGIDRPITLTAPLPGIAIPGGAMMRCETAWHLAHWLRDFVRPAARLLPGQPRLVALEPGSTYQCRATVGNATETLSEHAFGNAFDLAGFVFSDGSRIEIAPRADKGDLAAAFQQAVRSTACLHFTTVLGPGSNAAHDNHLHLDIKARKSGWRLCQ